MDHRLWQPHSLRGPAAHFEASLRAAGYDPFDGRGHRAAKALYAIATLMDSGRAGARPARKLGRNDPCRCGSGKKYKRCCLRRDSGSTRSADAAPHREPYELPRLHDDASILTELGSLAKIVSQDPDLRRWVPSGEHLDEFAQDYPEVLEWNLDAEQVDDLGQEFAGDYLEPADYDDLFDAFLEAGKRCDPGSSTRRTLVLGAFLAHEGRDGIPDPDLLGITLFRLGLAAYRTRLELYRQVEARLRGENAASAPGADEKASPLGKLAAQLADESGVSSLLRFQLVGELLADELDVPLPLASLLPLKAAIESHDAEDDRSASAMFEHAYARLGDEDVRLLIEYSNRALQDGRFPPLRRARVSLTCAWLESEHRDELLKAVALGSLRAEECAEILYLDEPGILPDDGDWFAPGPLERYADHLERCGYVELAERTRDLIGAFDASP